MSKTWAKGSTRLWRKTRLYVLNRDHWICQLCDQPIDPAVPYPEPMSASVHHIKGKRYGDNPADLAAAHRQCNLDVGEPGRHDPQPQPMTRW